MTPIEESAQIVERLILQRRTTFGGKRIDAVGCPAARHVETHIAVALVLFTAHKNLRAVVNLRNAARRQQERLRLFPSAQVGRLDSKEAVGVVIVVEREYVLWIRIDHIESKVVVKVVQAFSPR